MDATWTIGIICVGITVVVGGILALRLHAFLALTFGALTVALLTPRAATENYLIGKDAIDIEKASVIGAQLQIDLVSKLKVVEGDSYVIAQKPTDGGRYSMLAFLSDLRPNPGETESRRINGRVSFPRSTNTTDAEYLKNAEDGARLLNSDGVAIAVIRRAPFDAAVGLSGKTIAVKVAEGFGNTAMKIGILIAMASIVGKCLLDSGAADRIVRSTLNVVGEKFAPVSFVVSGFLLGIPVFFDTVFYLMIPLGKAMHLRLGKNYLLFVLTIVAGATMAHSLVPPTPGPLLVASELGVDIGMMIMMGMIIGFFPAAFGYFYAAWFANKIWKLPLRESAEFSMKDLEELSQRDESQLPPFWLSVLPIVLPVILIGGGTLFSTLKKAEILVLGDTMQEVVDTFGDKNIALIISAIIAMVTLVRTRGITRKQLSESVGAALASGGTIILITSAGGAFGKVLQQTGVAMLIEDISLESPAAIITVAWLITAAIRTAQGSATVAMITAVGILGGLASDGNLGFHPVYLAVAIGCGSKPIAWMNDSGFWVITRMSGMTEAEGLKYVTPMTTLMGVVGLITTIVAVTLFPMAG
jgi:GntP family gluconate:H+ symporter